MDTGERLAAYLSGDLDPDERTALEAELAGDPSLRGHLERIRHADRTLAALPDVELPDGFHDRLQDRLAPELDAVLSDELAARRARRGAPRWVLAASAAAAVLAVVAGGISVVTGGGADDAAESAGGDAGVALDREASGATGMADTLLTPSSGPVVADRGRTLDRDDLQALATDPDVQAALTDGPVATDPAAVALDYATALGMPSGTTAFEGDDGTAVPGEDAGTEAPPRPPTAASDLLLDVRVLGEVSEQERATVGACLAVLYEATEQPVVPVYAELAEDTDGTPVVVYAALAPDADGDYRRLEVWMLDRDTCQVRLFVQDDLG